MINLELPKKIEDTRALLRQFAEGGLRPLSRKYDLAEQKEMPEELYELSKLLRARPGRSGDGPGHDVVDVGPVSEAHPPADGVLFPQDPTDLGA